jgi:hypothetical protein
MSASGKRADQRCRAKRRLCSYGLPLAYAAMLMTGSTGHGQTARQDSETALGRDFDVHYVPPFQTRVPRWLGMQIPAPLVQAAAKADDGASPASRDALFGGDKPAADKPQASAWTGFVLGEVARAFRDPAHWSKLRLRTELTRKGQFSEQVKWTIGGRFDYDAAYDRSSFYPAAVREDQRYGFALRENYLDINAGDWEFRLGRQHVVWGEMVGLFFADVVSAKDLHEFILPELNMLRIPQWAARAEYFKDDNKIEFLWIPVPSFNEIGKPGAEFYPNPIHGPGGTVVQGEDRPSRKLANSNYGLRLSALKNGWDVSGFYYHSVDAAQTFYRQVIPLPAPVFVYQPRHDKIDQFGGTVAKDLGTVVLKGEAVYTSGRKYNVIRVNQPNGLVEQGTLDYAIGLDFNLPAETRLNLQFYQRIYTNHDPDTLQSKYESGVTILVNSKVGRNLEAEALLIHSLNRSDWLFRPRLSWAFERNWRLVVGADIFSGPPTGLFGQYDNKDRLYTEVRYSF